MQASGRRMKLGRIVSAIDFLLIDVEGDDDEAQLFWKAELQRQLVQRLRSTCGSEQR